MSWQGRGEGSDDGKLMRLPGRIRIKKWPSLLSK